MIKNEYVEVRNMHHKVVVRAKSGKQSDRILKQAGLFSLLGTSLTKVNVTTHFTLPLGSILQSEI